MRRVAIQRRPLTPAAVLVALLALGGVAPGRALASCGDYLTTAPNPGHTAPHELPVFAGNDRTAGMDNLTRDDGSRMPVEEPRARRANPSATPCRQCPRSPEREPCRGPRCSDDHAPLPVPVSAFELAPDPLTCDWCAVDLAHRGS